VNILEERDLAAGEGLIPGTLQNVGSCGAAEAGYDTAQNADRGGLLYVSASDTCYVHALEIIDSTSGFDPTDTRFTSTRARTSISRTVNCPVA
jgi:hypothetical protein